jgi:hypothetical protein
LQSLQASLNKAIALELQHIRENKHVFKKSRGNQQQQRHHQQGAKSGERAAVSKDHKSNKNGAKLSFLQDEDDEAEG